ncbi:FAD-binding oxidoreductase [Ammoniphilus sp. CFH 90114]|uniref:NAD(P)/FAD-dependent oxidoreductase n=1 Tax=Ammoniphilus sp. CFH 90114 TaxID=2493665 RepID=UPI00100DE2B5|nr:FAD-dependent oxidoreductase [Ammoniphilus sp. CFH 90114]RXT06507.1 FAD-binding oxidoreductase [Ammoniphilus sp. CFH 90114]
MKSADVVVIGGGVIGTSIAFRLAQQGRKTILIEKGAIGAATSGSCDKAVFLQSKKPGFHLELAKASREVYENLEEELQTPFEFQKCGGMIVIETEAQLEFMQKFVKEQQQANIPIELLSRKEALTLQPNLSPHILGATWGSEDAEVNPLLLSYAFVKAAKSNGAEIISHTEVTGIATINGQVSCVHTTQGDIATAAVINAGGPFAPKISEMVGIDLPIQPRRGVILITEKVAPFLKGNVLCAQYITAKHLHKEANVNDNPYGIGLSLGQTESGNLLIGGSREFKGFNREVGPVLLESIAQHACRIFPSLGSIRLIRTMVGFRPFTGDGLPIIDRAPEIAGYYIAAGHEGDGIALSPITGHLVSCLLDGGGPYNHLLDHLRLSRFQPVVAN